MTDFRETTHPLQWPDARPRTKLYRRQRSRFSVTLAKARDELFAELGRMGACNIVLSTNLSLRQDGLPYANQRQPEDAGAAVYFEYKGDRVAFACDRWDKIEHNVQAIRHTIAALRGIARWGTGDMVKAAFRGFKALPAPETFNAVPWWDILEVVEGASRAEIEAAYRAKARALHPDTGGDHKAMAQLNIAITQARAAR